jgi:predicted ATPase
MNEGKKFRVYPPKEQRFIYNSKVGEVRYFRKFKNKSLSLIGEDVPCDQKYNQSISADTNLLEDVLSQIRNASTDRCRRIRDFSKSFRAGLLSKRSMALNLLKLFYRNETRHSYSFSTRARYSSILGITISQRM